MKKFFFLMMAMVVLVSSCQEKEKIRKEEIHFYVYSTDGSNDIRGMVTCSIPVSKITIKEMNKLVDDVSKIVETNQSPRKIRSQIKERIYKIGGSHISFKIKIREKTIRRDADLIHGLIWYLSAVMLLSPLVYISCRE